MKDVTELFYSLPIELRSKIMFKSGIIHPVAEIFNDFKLEYCYLMNNLYNLENLEYFNLSFYNYLCEINYLKSYGYTMEELMEALNFHMYIPDSDDDVYEEDYE
tara:strand:+ start:2330 stop:2641 length:312 start_codon:yes stop_codon:yes gene_type:complete